RGLGVGGLTAPPRRVVGWRGRANAAGGRANAGAPDAGVRGPRRPGRGGRSGPCPGDSKWWPGQVRSVPRPIGPRIGRPVRPLDARPPRPLGLRPLMPLGAGPTTVPTGALIGVTRPIVRSEGVVDPVRAGASLGWNVRPKRRI